MPLDFGLGEFFTEEYQRFIDGLQGLSDGGQRNARAAAARIDARFPATRTITIPSWDDVIRIRPRPTITDTMREAHYAAKRNNQPSPLAPELQEELARRARRARSMATSAAPGYAQAYGQVMTAIDNVQDLLTTSATVGRFGLVGASRLLDALAPTIGGTAAQRAAFEALERAGFLSARQAAARVGLGLGARTLGRVVPILGPILIAADILKLITWLGLALFPTYALVCSGLTAALAAGALPAAQAMAGKRAGKRKVGNLGKANPWSMTARLDRQRTLREWRPSIFNLLEVAQTTEQLFGVGLSFGGLVGLVSETVFASEAKRRGLNVRVDTSEVPASLARLLQEVTRDKSNAELRDALSAAGVLAHGPVLQGVQEVFTFEEHVDALVAQNVAWSVLRPVVERPEFEDAIALALDHWWAPPAPQYTTTRAIVLLETGDWRGEGLWPLPGAPERIQGVRYYEDSAARCTQALGELLLPRGDDPAAGFAAQLAVQQTDRAVILMTGAEDAVALRWKPDWALLEALALAGRVPIASEDEGRLMAFWRSCLDEMERTGRQQLAAKVYDELADRAGIHLLQVDAGAVGEGYL